MLTFGLSTGMGKKGMEASKQGIKRAKKFATKKKTGKGGNEAKDKGVNEDEKGTMDGADDVDEAEGGESDDAKSEFSLGDLADVGNKDF